MMPKKRDDHEYIVRKILRLYFEEKMTAKEIAKELKQDPEVKAPVTVSAIRNIIHRNKNQGDNKITQWNSKDDPKLEELYNDGFEISHIVVMFDKSPATVQNRIAKLGLTNRKITLSQKQAIEEQLRVGDKNMVEIALEMGITHAQVRHVSDKIKKSPQDLRKFNPGYKNGSTFERQLRKPLTGRYGDAVLPKQQSKDWSGGQYEIDLPIDFLDGHKFAIELNHVRIHADRQHQDYQKRALAKAQGWVWIPIWYDGTPDKALVDKTMEIIMKIIDENYAGKDDFYKEYLKKVEEQDRKFYLPDQPPYDPKKDVNFGPFWLPQEEDIVQDNWDKKTLEEIMAMLPGRSSYAIQHKAHQLGLTDKRPNYSPKEDGILTKYYATLSDEELMELLPGRSAQSIRTHASRLGLKKESHYTEGEDNVLRQYYPTSSDEQLLKLLPGRSIGSIKTRANRLQLKKRSYWTPYEDQQLRNLYPNGTRAEIMDALPGRSWDAIATRASRLRIRRLIPFD